MPYKKSIFTCVLILVCVCESYSQIKTEDKIITNAVVVDGDTLAHMHLKEVLIFNPDLIGLSPAQKRKYKRRIARKRKRYNKLRRNVYKTYPYAVMAGYIVHDIDSAMQKIRSKDARKMYKQRKEKELMAKYKGKLENLTMSQGRTLVILISRETGKDCYTIIKDLKGGFNARIWQTLATLFSNNLKRKYDPINKDMAIEQIVQEIESQGQFRRSG